MRYSYFLICILFIITQRSHASYPAEAVEDEPAVAIEPAPIISEVAPAKLEEPQVVAPAPLVAPAEYVRPAPVIAAQPVVAPSSAVARAPVVAPAPIVAPTPVVAQAPIVQPAPVAVPAPAPVPVPVPVAVHHYHPRTEVRNIATSYKKESGHRSDTVMVSGADHFPSALEFHPHGHFFDHAAFPVPLRAHTHRKKLASKKAARAHKSFAKKN